MTRPDPEKTERSNAADSSSHRQDRSTTRSDARGSRADNREDLLAAILGEEHPLTAAEVSEQSGVPEDEARRLWRALGFPDPGEESAFGPTDVEAVRLVNLAFETGVLDVDTVMRLSRALGQTMARLSDWQASIIVDQLDGDILKGKYDNRLEAAAGLAETLVPSFQTLMNYAWRRHLAAAAGRLEALGAADSELLTSRFTVGFADLSRFTALSNRLSGTELAHVVEDFESRATDLITASGGRVIKTLGDAVLFVCDDAQKATGIGLEIIPMIAGLDELPDIRVGLATGMVLSRLGDVFGPPVNLAARLSQVARANRVLVDDATAVMLGSEFETRKLPSRPIKGFGNLSPITVSRRHDFQLR